MDNGKFGRQLKDTLSCITFKLTPDWPDLDKLKEDKVERQIKQKANLDLRHRVKDLPTPEPGQDVWTQECYR